MKMVLSIATVAFTLIGGMSSSPARAQGGEGSAGNVPPTIVLVHGAFAESSSWSAVIDHLRSDGYPVVAAANPLRSLKGDAAYISGLVRSIEGPVILVGHSYGGSVISNVGNDGRKVKALVYVSAFAPDTGETALALSAKFPGSTLAGALAAPVSLGGGVNDLYIRQEQFPSQFADDVPMTQARNLAVSQRPVTDAALAEPSGNPNWTSLPSWWIYGTGDRNIPPAAMAFMAKRAHSLKTVVVEGASHVVMISHHREVADLIEAAAETR